MFYAIPRRNTSDIAHRLLARFGSLYGVFNASMDELKSVDGVGESVASFLYLVGCCGECFLNGAEIYYGVYQSNAFVAHVKKAYPRIHKEIADVYLLDDEGNILTCKRFTDHCETSVAVPTEAITKLLLEYKPSGLVMVHNHPTGQAKPSEKDEETTMSCQMLCSLHNVIFCDHIIYSRSGVYSYYLSGRMQEISARFSMGSVLGKPKEDPRGEKA